MLITIFLISIKLAYSSIIIPEIMITPTITIVTIVIQSIYELYIHNFNIIIINITYNRQLSSKNFINSIDDYK